MSAIFPDDETKKTDASGSLLEDLSEPVNPAIQTGGDPLRLSYFRRQIEAMQWRIDNLRPDHGLVQLEAFEALETTMEELRVAVEELRLTNESLRDSRAEVEAERRRYRDLFDLAPDAYLVTDLQGTIREANRAATAQLNIDSRHLIGKPLVVFLPKEARSAFRVEIARLRRETGTSEYELRLKPRKLPSIDASIRVGVVRDAWGQPVALRWTIRDVSSKKRAEEKIRALNSQLERRVVERSEQLESAFQTNERMLIKAHAADPDASPAGGFFQDILDEVDAILWRADAVNGCYTFVSRRAEELLGYPPNRWLDDPNFWSDRIHPEDREWAIAYRRKQLRERVDHEAEYRVIAVDGRTLWFREAVRVLKHEPDGPSVLYGLMVNITKRKKVERQLYTAKGELTARLRDMTYLHELGRRLTAARGWRATVDEVLSAAASLLGTDLAILRVRESEANGQPITASIGLPEEFARRVVESGFLEASLPSKEPFTIEDIEAESEGSVWREVARFGGFRALAAVPLFNREGEPLGSIITCFRAPYRVPEGQLRLIEIYAEQAAEAIEAARLVGRIDDAGRRNGEAIADQMRTPLAAILEAANNRDLVTVEQQARLLAELIGRLSH
jgi:PAS domain S-box-containing protein